MLADGNVISSARNKIFNMRKELDYFYIENALGWNQEWFQDWSMYDGGCAAVTACDLCIYLARVKGVKALYPYRADNLNKTDYLSFSAIMKKYLHPSWQGIDTLERYLSGLSAYWNHAGAGILKADGLHGTVSWKEAAGQIRERIDDGILVPYLLLYHKNSRFKDFQWHWFNLAGYEKFEDEFYVKAVTYGDFCWFNLRELWGIRKKVGLYAYLHEIHAFILR